MSRIIHDVPVNAAAFAQQTSASTADVKTLTPPTAFKAHACLITVETTSARVTFNGDAPDATHGQLVQAGQAPLYLPFARPIKAASSAAAASIVNVTWLA
jgi:hypothetical protein